MIGRSKAKFQLKNSISIMDEPLLTNHWDESLLSRTVLSIKMWQLCPWWGWAGELSYSTLLYWLRYCSEFLPRLLTWWGGSNAISGGFCGQVYFNYVLHDLSMQGCLLMQNPHFGAFFCPSYRRFSSGRNSVRSNHVIDQRKSLRLGFIRH